MEKGSGFSFDFLDENSILNFPRTLPCFVWFSTCWITGSFATTIQSSKQALQVGMIFFIKSYTRTTLFYLITLPQV